MSKPKMIKPIDGFTGVADADVLSRGYKRSNFDDRCIKVIDAEPWVDPAKRKEKMMVPALSIRSAS